eukprot:4714975-Pleurochrysis_carterae.AAC.1
MRSRSAWTSPSTHPGRWGVELPPFKVDNKFAVEFLRAALDSAVGTSIKRTFCLTEAVAVQVGQ